MSCLAGRRGLRGRWFAAALLVAGTLVGRGQNPAAEVRSRKARLVVETGIHYGGETKGLGRMALEALVQQCNVIRQGTYKLPPQRLAEETLHLADTTRQESWFDGTGYALSLDTVRVVSLPDLLRWTKAAASGGGYPAVAPDCGSFQRLDAQHGTLWRAGKRYSLDYQKKRAVLQPGRAMDLAPVAVSPAIVGSGFPQESVAGQTCSSSGPFSPLAGNMMTTVQQCVWNDFGGVVWMNLPLSLRRTVEIGAGKKQINVSVAETADAFPKFAKDTFEFPAGFTVIEGPGAPAGH